MYRCESLVSRFSETGGYLFGVRILFGATLFTELFVRLKMIFQKPVASSIMPFGYRRRTPLIIAAIASSVSGVEMQ